MGIIIAKFRKKQTTYEMLEKLETQIRSIEEFGRNTEEAQKKTVGRFVLISVCTYSILALTFYFYCFPASLIDRIIYIIPLILLPFILLFLKKILAWYYNRKLRNNEKKLFALKDEKKKILDDVMDKETYKVAKQILEKFDPEQNKKNILEMSQQNVCATPQLLSSVSQSKGQLNTGVRYRLPVAPAVQRQSILKTPMPHQQNLDKTSTAIANTSMARAILPKDRSFLDKMVDYLVGDGPSNRYALICKSCSGHNGMALKEEFEYLSFKCCYCLYFNNARKKRPFAPKLETEKQINQLYNKAIDSTDVTTSESEKKSNSSTSSSDTDDDVENLNSNVQIEEINDTTEQVSPNNNIEDSAKDFNSKDIINNDQLQTSIKTDE